MSNKSTDQTKQKLQSLRDLLQADPVKLDTDDMLADVSTLPVSQNVKVIDYEEEDKKTIQDATDVIDSIILNYIKSEKVLNGYKLKSIRKQHIDTLADFMFLKKNARRNLITMQEAIDSGDMSKDAFSIVRDYQNEVQKYSDSIAKHMDKCENYWNDYADKYGLENEEEKNIQESEVKPDEGKKTTVTDMKALNNVIAEKMKEMAEKRRKGE
jgi:hypothetical protein